MKMTLPLIAAALIAASGATMAGDAGAGKAKFNGTCAACHGAKGEGNDALKAPQLAGQDAATIAKKLTDFKSGAVAGTTMPAMTAGLSEADIANLAAYIATL